MEKKETNGTNQLIYVAGLRHEPRAVTNELLDRMEAGGYRVALIAFMNRVGEVQVASAESVEVRSFLRFLHAEWQPDADEDQVRLMGN